MESSENKRMTLDWLIIGGGIHGVHIVARLIGEGEIDSERVGILDPAEKLLARWRACTAVTGMRYLRSPAVHHLDLSPWSLQRFAGKRKTRARDLFAAPYDRPSLDLFNTHCEHVVENFGLADLHIRDRALTCSIDCDGVVVKTASGADLMAQNIVLAMGASEQPLWPSWAPRDHARVHHVFEPGFDESSWASSSETLAIVGGGITAGQVALRMKGKGHRVCLISRHPFLKHQFDSDPGWLGPKNMARFRCEQDLERRRAIIGEARHRGSMPPDVWHAIRRAVEQDQIPSHQTEIDELICDGDTLHLRLANGDELAVDRVLLATGFVLERPGGALVDDLIASASLPCAQCGFPVIDTALRWHPRIFVTGPLAELELGPVSRNIAGARRAAERIVAAL